MAGGVRYIVLRTVDPDLQKKNKSWINTEKRFQSKKDILFSEVRGVCYCSHRREKQQPQQTERIYNKGTPARLQERPKTHEHYHRFTFVILRQHWLIGPKF